MEIQIHIADKIAAVQDAPLIVCGNSDYEIRFSFDSEWDIYTAKTARFVYQTRGEMHSQDVVFEGDTVTVPPLYDVYEVAVGVYAGDIHTTTPARIPCTTCITDGNPAHDAPTPDVYNQLMEYLAKIAKGQSSGIVTATPLTDGGVYGQVAEATFADLEVS